MDAEKCGILIRNKRIKKNMTQDDLASKVHVTRTAVSKWERDLSLPDVASLEPIADALGITVTELMHGETVEKVLPEAEEGYRELSKAANSQKIETDKKRRHYIAAIGAIVLFVITAIGVALDRNNMSKAPTITLKESNSYESCYVTNTNAWRLTIYEWENGTFRQSSFTYAQNLSNTPMLYIYCTEEYGVQTRWMDTLEDLRPEQWYENDYTVKYRKMKWADHIETTEKEQILAIDANHDLQDSLSDLMQDPDLNTVIITVSWTQQNG